MIAMVWMEYPPEDGTEVSMFYAFQYLKDEDTTAGEPNKITGKYSIAGDLVAFESWIDRRVWVIMGNILHGYNRKEVTVDEARRLCGGMSGKEYTRYLGNIGESK